MHTTRHDVEIPAGDLSLRGILVLPENPKTLVLFAHGSGSSRFSPRNRHVAGILNANGFATLLCDLLDAEEHAHDAVTAEFRFDIPVLTRRLVAIMDWTRQYQDTRALPLCLLGASTGCAAALMAAAERPRLVRAIVSHGGRPDLAPDALDSPLPPVLLIVGMRDKEILKLNQDAADRMWDIHELAVIPGASHLFEEPGMLELVAHYAAEWFATHGTDSEKTKASQPIYTVKSVQGASGAGLHETGHLKLPAFPQR